MPLKLLCHLQPVHHGGQQLLPCVPAELANLGLGQQDVNQGVSKKCPLGCFAFEKKYFEDWCNLLQYSDQSELWNCALYYQKPLGSKRSKLNKKVYFSIHTNIYRRNRKHNTIAFPVDQLCLKIQ